MIFHIFICIYNNIWRQIPRNFFLGHAHFKIAVISEESRIYQISVSEIWVEILKSSCIIWICIQNWFYPYIFYRMYYIYVLKLGTQKKILLAPIFYPMGLWGYEWFRVYYSGGIKTHKCMGVKYYRKQPKFLGHLIYT